MIEMRVMDGIMTFTGKPDYWSLLGISPDSDRNQLKEAFRKEARKWHPDLNKNDQNAEERFKLINEAYAVLSDPSKRILWEKDNNYSAPIDDQFKEGFPSYEEYIHLVLGINIGEHESDYEEYQEVNNTNVENFVNEVKDYSEDYTPTTSSVPPPPVKLEDNIETLIQLTVEEAIYGANIEIQLPDNTLVEIRTPKFAGDGWRLRLEGIAKGGRDHFIQLSVITNEGLRIDGLRVLYRLELSPPEAILGCAVDVPTLNGDVTLQVPPRSSSGRLLRLRGRGLKYEDYVGDQYVEVVIVSPEFTSDSEIALYKRLLELSANYE